MGLLVPTMTAWSYSDAGHKIVATLAWQQLSPFARQNIERILGVGEAPFIEASVWADKVKSDDRYTYLKPMHYVNLPKDAHQYDRKRDCHQDKCVVQAIKEFSQHAKSPERKKARLALRMLVHLIGDIHQPMHAGLKDDRGGNWYRVKYQGKNLNLHKLWDNQLVKRIDADWRKAAEVLKAPIAPEVLTPERWAEESHKLALEVAYDVKEGKAVSAEYLQQADDVTRTRLALASWRLAMWLNRLW